MKQTVSNLQELIKILENPNAYKIYVKHVNAYISTTSEWIKKKSLNELDSNIKMQQLYYENLH